MKDKKRGMQLYILAGIIIVLTLVVVFSFLEKESLTMNMVSGTEYISGEEGQVIIRLDNQDMEPKLGAKCTVSILFPNKIYFIKDKEMLPSKIIGNYYFSFVTPEDAGIYEEDIVCNVDSGMIHTSSSFHVSTGLNMIAVILENQELLAENISRIDKEIGFLEENISDKIQENQKDLLQKFSLMGNAIKEVFIDF